MRASKRASFSSAPRGRAPGGGPSTPSASVRVPGLLVSGCFLHPTRSLCHGLRDLCKCSSVIREMQTKTTEVPLHAGLGGYSQIAPITSVQGHGETSSFKHCSKCKPVQPPQQTVQNLLTGECRVTTGASNSTARELPQRSENTPTRKRVHACALRQTGKTRKSTNRGTDKWWCSRTTGRCQLRDRGDVLTHVTWVSPRTRKLKKPVTKGHML